MRSPGGWRAHGGPLSPSCTDPGERKKRNDDEEEQENKMKNKRMKRNLLIVQVHDGLLKVADPAVDQLGAPTARPRREIASLDESSLEV